MPSGDIVVWNSSRFYSWQIDADEFTALIHHLLVVGAFGRTAMHHFAHDRVAPLTCALGANIVLDEKLSFFHFLSFPVSAEEQRF
jgi:hypothetical protein